MTIPDNGTGTRHRKPGLILNETTSEAGRLEVERLAAEISSGGLTYILETAMIGA